MLTRLAALTIIAFAGLTAVAAAADIAYTKTASNLRAGPGTSYDILTTLPRNTQLLVEACTATWCAVTTEDDDEGFIAKSLLKSNPSGPDIPFSIRIIVGPEGPFIDFGDIFVAEPDEPDPDFPEVCFYQQANFRGANFCVEEGDADSNIPGSFDNNIESVLISGGLGVELCSGVNHGGDCFYYTESKRTLPGFLRNRITSYIVDDGQGGFDLGDEDDFGGDDFGDDTIILELN